jgi:hypothetical protein
MMPDFPHLTTAPPLRCMIGEIERPIRPRCALCRRPFRVGEELLLIVVGARELGYHVLCAGHLAEIVSDTLREAKLDPFSLGFASIPAWEV